jgi:hypothetical protein
MTSRWARFTRGWIVALFSTFVAALSHTVGGAAAPGWLTIVGSLVFAAMFCVALSGRTLSFWRSAASVLVSQFMFHGLFALGASGGALSVGAADPTQVHHHSALPVLVDQTVLSSSAHLAHDGTTMWLAHFGAAIVTIFALRFGERAFWGLVDNVRLGIRTLFAPGHLAVPVPAPHRIGHDAPVFAPRDLILVLAALRYRGPPVFVLAA